jgi:hypothetical protein
MLRVLLADREPMVLASAMFAFAEVCLSNGQQQLSGANKQQKKNEKKAARSDDDDSSDDDEDEEEAALDIWAFLHPHFKKYCHLLADLDEWGQMQALHVLTMYGRANFASPFKVCMLHLSSILSISDLILTFMLTVADGLLILHVHPQLCMTQDELVKAAAASSGKPEKERAFYSDDEDEEDGKGDDDASYATEHSSCFLLISVFYSHIDDSSLHHASSARRSHPRKWTPTIVCCCGARAIYCTLRTAASCWLRRPSFRYPRHPD